MPAGILTNKYIIVLSVFLVFVLGGVATWYYLALPPRMDGLILQVLEETGAVRFYSQQVETSVELTDRKLNIVGTYSIDEPARSFLSFATTTLIIPDLAADEREHVFTVQNISIGDDIYVRVDTQSDLLKLTIPANPDWRHFTKGSIPKEYENIATAGPVLDNLKLLGEQGAYLSLVKKPSIDTWGGETLTRYSFVLSETMPEHAGGTLPTLIERIGNGTVDVWIDPETATLKYMKLENETYHSTTTFQYRGAVPAITRPTTDEN